MMAVPRLQSQTAGWTSSPHLTFSPQQPATSSASLLNCLASLHKSSPSPTTCTGSSCASAACLSCLIRSENHLHLIGSSTSASQESALAKSPLTTLSSLSKEFLILPFHFCCLKFWFRKWNSETLRYFFRDPDFWISILERKTTLRYIWQHLTKFPFQLLTMFFYRTQVWS